MKSNKERAIGILIGLKIMASQCDAPEDDVITMMSLFTIITKELFPDIKFSDREELMNKSDAFICSVIETIEREREKLGIKEELKAIEEIEEEMDNSEHQHDINTLH